MSQQTMNILYIAYSCSPDRGSEDRIGWKLPSLSGEEDRVFVITKAEHKEAIESYRKQHPDLQVRFFYVDIPPVYKKLFRGFAYSGRLNVWHKRAVALAQQLCAREKIHIIHQITPVEFRSIGDYGKIPNVKFVCGPIGGGEYIPKGLRYYERRHIAQELIRKVLNRISLIRLQKRGVLARCDAVLFANEETKRYVSAAMGEKTVQACRTEIGIDPGEIVPKCGTELPGQSRRFLVAGRLIYRKGHEFLLDALSELPEDLDYTCTILGSGPELRRLKNKCKKSGLEHRVCFREKVPFDQMGEIYANTHALIMPSIRETTGSVLLEAMSRGIPVITIGRFGGSGLIHETAGWLYDGNSKREFIENLKKILIACIQDPEGVYTRGQQAAQLSQEHTWDKKTAYYRSIYKQLLKETQTEKTNLTQ